MGSCELADEATIVMLTGAVLDDSAERVTAETPAALLALISEHVDCSKVVVALDAACQAPSPEETSDHVIALASVLAQHGVQAFVTRHVVTVRRILSTLRAIQVGTVEDGRVAVVPE